MPPRKPRENLPKNFWSVKEEALALFLRSRRVRDKSITIVLNERYAPIVRQSGAIRCKMRLLRKSESALGNIDLTEDTCFSAPENVDRWIRDKIDNPELTTLFTFTQHELDTMKTSVRELNSRRGGSLLVTGPGPEPHNQAIPRPENIQPWIGPGNMPAIQEPRERGYYEPGVGPSQMLDPRAMQVMGGQGQMPSFPTPHPNAPPHGAGRLVWDAELERLFPGMGPPPFHEGFPFGEQQAAGSGAAEYLYQQNRDFEEWYSQEREEEGEDDDDEDDDDKIGDYEDREDGDEEDEDGEDDDGLNEYRPQRDDNDNCWYDEDQEEFDG